MNHSGVREFNSLARALEYRRPVAADLIAVAAGQG